MPNKQKLFVRKWTAKVTQTVIGKQILSIYITVKYKYFSPQAGPGKASSYESSLTPK